MKTRITELSNIERPIVQGGDALRRFCRIGRCCFKCGRFGVHHRFDPENRR
jgi:hypothetical protein